ncbi:hypothetical protein [Microbulbifer sp. TRSA007]|uniref:hypothetical protein n=1 Tax=Microbulbifer sp. TRSA007 TaxID=3243384 RepID=UPI00403A25D6
MDFTTNRQVTAVFLCAFINSSARKEIAMKFFSEKTNTQKKQKVRVITGGKTISVAKSALTPIQSSATCACRDCQIHDDPK